MSLLPEDTRVPGGVYLCQINHAISCGSCCGLYNIPGLNRDRLRNILAERTVEFAEVPRTVDAITAFEQQRLAVEGKEYPIRNFHHCVFTGLIHDNGERPGCLLHPLASGNNGIDWRGLSFYGGAACKLYFCPTYTRLPTRWKHLLRTVLTDWYAYGLIIPEYRFVSAAFTAVETRADATLSADLLSPTTRTALAELLLLKLDWPYRHDGTPLAKNFFSTRKTDRPGLLGTHAPVDELLRPILHELDTAPEFLDAATCAVENRLFPVLQALLHAP